MTPKADGPDEHIFVVLLLFSFISCDPDCFWAENRNKNADLQSQWRTSYEELPCNPVSLIHFHLFKYINLTLLW